MNSSNFFAVKTNLLLHPKNCVGTNSPPQKNSLFLSLRLHLIIPISEGGLLIVLKMNEGDIKFLYAMKLVPPKNLGSIVHLSTIHNNTIPESTGTTLNITFSVTVWSYTMLYYFKLAM